MRRHVAAELDHDLRAGGEWNLGGPAGPALAGDVGADGRVRTEREQRALAQPAAPDAEQVAERELRAARDLDEVYERAIGALKMGTAPHRKAYRVSVMMRRAVTLPFQLLPVMVRTSREHARLQTAVKA